MYIPAFIIRNMLIAMLLVFVSSNPVHQALSFFIILLLFSAYSIFFCPYPTLLRVFIHLSEVVMLAQSLTMLFMVLTPEKGRISTV